MRKERQQLLTHYEIRISLAEPSAYAAGMADITLQPAGRPFVATITPPGSKSLTNRALILAALAKGRSTISNILLADDTAAMIDCLRRLSFTLDVDRAGRSITVGGRGGAIPANSAELFAGNSGTTIRFVAALCGLGRGEYTLDGIPRMRQRPIGQLVDLLKNAGVRSQYLGEGGFPPIRVLADGLAGGIVRFPSAQSSQYLSALLMVAPHAKHELRVDLESGQTSWPYVAMTMQLMDEFGQTPELIRDPLTGEPRQIIVPQGTYRATDYAVEPDASAASYFLATAAINPGSKVMIEGLGKRSLQGDVGVADLLHRMGADMVFGPDFIALTGTDRLEGIEADLLGMPDLAQTLAVVAVFATGPTVLRGLRSLRVKETDRLAALQAELTKLGATVTIEDDDVLIIDPPDSPAAGRNPVTIDTYDDHRMAMSFAVAGTRIAGVTIRNAECVSKTYPEFFEDLARATSST